MSYYFITAIHLNNLNDQFERKVGLYEYSNPDEATINYAKHWAASFVRFLKVQKAVWCKEENRWV